MAGRVTHPDGCAQHQNVGIKNPSSYLRPFIAVTFVRGNTWSNILVRHSHSATPRNPVGHKGDEDLVNELVGARGFTYGLKRTVDGERAQFHCPIDLFKSGST